MISELPVAAAVSEPAALQSLSDAQLLSRFFVEREDAAFSALVERHGPLVLSVCRRVLRDATEAQDAFQATFLVLVQKGAGLKQPDRLANWLYGVALRTSRRVRSRAAVRNKSELQSPPAAAKSPIDGMTFEELRSILDEEISRLPTKYALPLVLCYLEGKTNAEAAAQLGWPAGSMSRRLSHARDLLRGRMAKRGLGLSIALLTAVFAKSIGPVPGRLAVATVKAGRRTIEGLPLGDAASPLASEIAKTVIQSMNSARLAALSTAAVAVALLVTTFVAIVTDPNSAPAIFAGNTPSNYAGDDSSGNCCTAPGGCGARMAMPVVATSAVTGSDGR